jgi:hypothetical protein
MRLLIVLCVLLAGCQERFRYPCQDPANWQEAACQRPGCAINGVCPEQLNRPTDMKMENEK